MKKKATVRRKFFLIDRENGNEKRQITMKEIVNHFNGDGTGPVIWNKNNVDLDRFKFEMDEIGYDFIIEQNRSKTRKKKRTQNGTITMGYAVMDIYTSFKAGSVTLTPPEIRTTVESIARETGVSCNWLYNAFSEVYGAGIDYVHFSGHIPFNKMPDFIKAARAAGFRVKE